MTIALTLTLPELAVVRGRHLLENAGRLRISAKGIVSRQGVAAVGAAKITTLNR